MMDINYQTLKEYCAVNNIKSPKQYMQLWKETKLPSNFPCGIVAWLKYNDPTNFISLDDLFPERMLVRVKRPNNSKYIKKIKTPKSPQTIIKKLSNRYTYAEAILVVRKLGLQTSDDWREYCINNKNNWNYRLPKTPEKYYSKTNEWKSWSHFLIGDHVREKMSQGEREIFTILTTENVYFEMNKRFPDLKEGKLSFDFYIPSFNLIIEYDGIYHFNRLKRTEEQFQRQIANDQLKHEYCINRGLKFRRIAYYEHNYIPQILFNLGLTKNADHKLLRRARKDGKQQGGIPKNYKYHSISGGFTYEEVFEIRQFYLSGHSRTEIENLLNIKLSRYVFSEMVRNRTYFDSSYDKSKRIEPPKPQKKIRTYSVDPILLLELKNAHKKKKEIILNHNKPIALKIGVLKEQLKNTKEWISKLPKKTKVVKTTVPNVYTNQSNFSVFGEYKHYGRYTYENFVYKGKDIKGEVTCKIHGGFMQTPHNHLSVTRGSQCPKCAKANLNNPLPWRDIRKMKVYTNKEKIVTRVNTQLKSELQNSMRLIKNEIIRLENEMRDSLIDVEKEINIIKTLLYPTNVSKTIENISKPLIPFSNIKKLTYEDVCYILENKNLGMKRLSKLFSVDRKTIQRIRRGLSYKVFVDKYFETQKKLPENF